MDEKLPKAPAEPKTEFPENLGSSVSPTTGVPSPITPKRQFLEKYKKEFLVVGLATLAIALIGVFLVLSSRGGEKGKKGSKTVSSPISSTRSEPA